MVTIIDGEKGSGKTKKIIDLANNSIEARKGDSAFLSTTTRYRAEIKPQIKFLNLKEEEICSKDALFGFLRGLLAANYDLEYIFIDGILKILDVKADSEAMAELFMLLDKLGANRDIKFVLTISCAREKLPGFILKYLA